MICRVWSEAQLNESRPYKFTYFYCIIISYLFSHDLKDSPWLLLTDIIQKNRDLLELNYIQTSV